MCVLIPELTGNCPRNSLVPYWNHQSKDRFGHSLCVSSGRPRRCDPTRPDPTRLARKATLCLSAEEAVCAKISVCSRRSFRRFIQFARPFLYITSSLNRSRDFQDFFHRPPPPPPFLPHWSVYVASFACVPSLLSLRVLFCLVVFQQFPGFQRTFSNSPVYHVIFPWFSFFACKSILQFDCLQQGFGLLFGEGRKSQLELMDSSWNLAVQKSRRLQISLSFVNKGILTRE